MSDIEFVTKLPKPPTFRVMVELQDRPGGVAIMVNNYVLAVLEHEDKALHLKPCRALIEDGIINGGRINKTHIWPVWDKEN